MQCLRKFYSWLFLLCLSWDAVSLIPSYGMRLLDKEENKVENVIEMKMDMLTAKTSMETGYTSICKYMQRDNDNQERREYILKAGASHTGECFPAFFLFDVLI